MKIAIIGTRGIPNHYGGFEQFAEYLSIGLIKTGNEVTVYNSHKHPYQNNEWNGVRIIHCNDPEHKYGTIGQFIYDLNCIRNTKKQDYDIILQLGYTSNSIWGWLLPRKRTIIATNMDGLEWKRTKFSKPVRHFIKYAEKLAIKYSDYLIADSIGIQEYIKSTYGKDSIYIPYGATLFVNPQERILYKYNIPPYSYNMLIARLEPENSIEMILDGIVYSNANIPFLVIGKHHTKFGEYLKDKYKRYSFIRFEGGIYDIEILNNLRYFSNIYFHGHTVGGTNPSLLEAMASNALICAHNNVFNRSILDNDAFYFCSKEQVANLVQTVNKKDHLQKVNSNFDKINSKYLWPIIINQYLHFFTKISEQNNNS